VREAVEVLEGVVRVDIDLLDQSVSIVHYPQLSEAAIIDAITAAGFTVS